MNKTYVRGELVMDKIDNRLCRFSRYDTSPTGNVDIVLMDRNTGKELPDYRHPSQVSLASPNKQ